MISKIQNADKKGKIKCMMVAGQTVQIKRASTKKPATVTFAIDDDFARQLIEQEMGGDITMKGLELR